VLAITAVIFVVGGGLLVYSVVRFRNRKNDDGHRGARRRPDSLCAAHAGRLLEIRGSTLGSVVAFLMSDDNSSALSGLGAPARLPRTATARREVAVMDLSEYVLEPVHADEALALYRGRRRVRTASSDSSILLIRPVSEHPPPATLKRLGHEYSLAGELHSAWAARPVALTEHQGRTTLVVEDFGGRPLEALLGTPMQLGLFLRLAVGLAAALRELVLRPCIAPLRTRRPTPRSHRQRDSDRTRGALRARRNPILRPCYTSQDASG